MGISSPAELAPLLALLERSWGNSTMLQRTGGILAEALAAADVRAALSADAPAPLRNFAKDLDFVLGAARTTAFRIFSTYVALYIENSPSAPSGYLPTSALRAASGRASYLPTCG